MGRVRLKTLATRAYITFFFPREENSYNIIVTVKLLGLVTSLFDLYYSLSTILCSQTSNVHLLRQPWQICATKYIYSY